MPEIPTATFLHLSDLHLGRTFDDAGDSTKVSGPSTQAVMSYIKEGGFRLQTHDSIICSTLPTEIKSAARYLLAPEDLFDINIITGDISTRADSEERFEFARDFILTDINFQQNRTFCVPGNHDKWEEISPKRYLHGFKSIPAPPPYVRQLTIERSGQHFIFIGIDSNLYREGNMAAGKISDETFRFLEQKFAEFDKPEYAEAVRVLLLHHHPVDLNQFRRRQTLKRIARSIFDYEKFTRIENAEPLLTLCRGKIDIIMHGHEHFPIAFFDNTSGCFVISAGTTTLYHVKPQEINSFHAIAFYNKKITVVEYDKSKERGNFGAFRAARKWDGDLSNRTELRETILRN